NASRQKGSFASWSFCVTPYLFYSRDCLRLLGFEHCGFTPLRKEVRPSFKFSTRSLWWQWQGSRLQQIAEADATQQFSPNTIGNRINDLCTILGWINMHTERSLPERSINYLDDRIGYLVGM